MTEREREPVRSSATAESDETPSDGERIGQNEDAGSPNEEETASKGDTSGSNEDDTASKGDTSGSNEDDTASERDANGSNEDDTARDQDVHDFRSDDRTDPRRPVGMVSSVSETEAASFFAVGERATTDGEPAIGGGRVHGQIVEAAIVPADVVPTAYPWGIHSEHAIAFTVEFPNGTEAIFYVEHRDNGQDPRLARLLEVLETPYGSYADLYGERVLLEVEDGYWIPYVPRSTPRGSPRGVYGVIAGLAFNLVAILGVLVGGGALVLGGPFLVAFLLCNLVVIPAATVTDARYLHTHTDWQHGPLFWATCNAFPVLNVVVSAWYLTTRRAAIPIRP